MKKRVGLVVALPAEAKALAGNDWQTEGGRPVCREFSDEGNEFIWVCCGVGPERARQAANWLIRQKVTTLAVLGVSGGLAPELSSGQLIVAESVLNGEDPVDKNRWTCQKSAKLLNSLQKADIDAICGPVVSMARPVLEPNEKHQLYRRYGVMAVDMESAAVVRTAEVTGLDWFVLRAICDSADRRVPRMLYDILDSEGRPRLGFLVKELLRRPFLLADLIPMQRDFSRSIKALGRGGRALIR